MHALLSTSIESIGAGSNMHSMGRTHKNRLSIHKILTIPVSYLLFLRYLIEIWHVVGQGCVVFSREELRDIAAEFKQVSYLLRIIFAQTFIK